MASVEDLFWLKKPEWYADVLIAKARVIARDATPDDALRSNCLLLVSLGLVTDERAKKCVEAAKKYLVVPGALRSLAPLRFQSRCRSVVTDSFLTIPPNLIGRVTKATRTPGANRPITTAPPGRGRSQRFVKPWRGRGILRRNRSPRPRHILAAWNN